MSFLGKKISKSVLLILCAVSLLSAQVSTREYEVKAVFLYHFTEFVEWPERAFPGPQSPAVIGILGTDPFESYLQTLIANEKIGQHSLVIKHFSNVEDVTNCQILFINVSDKKNVDAIIEKLKGRSILTVSDANRFAKAGGMIRLYTRNEKVNIEMNLDAIKEENLVVSSKLLKLSQIVTTDKN